MSTKKEKLLSYINKKQIVRARDLKKGSIPSVYLNLLEKEKKIQKLSRGLYAANNYEFDETQSYMEVCQKAPHATICLLSALSFHNLTTQNPYQVWIAIDNKSWAPKIEYPPLRIVRFSGKALTEGIDIIKKQGSIIKVYCSAKTVADCFKYRNKIGLDVAIEALKDGIHKKAFTLKELNYYAKICRVQKIIKPYIESLL